MPATAIRIRGASAGSIAAKKLSVGSPRAAASASTP
jgi:hypothetical protein